MSLYLYHWKYHCE